MTATLRIAAVAAIFVAATAASGDASAMPAPRVNSAAGAMIDEVAYGCGPGWRPNYYGRCVPMRGPPPPYGPGFRPPPPYGPGFRPPPPHGPGFRPPPPHGPGFRPPPPRW